MKKIISSLSLMFLMFALSASSLLAQKVGHVDYGAILSAMPNVKIANQTIESYQKGFAQQAENLQKKIQTKYQDAMKKAQDGGMAPAEQKTVENELKKMQEDLEKFLGKADNDVAKKRKELLQPILKQVEDAVKAVAKEKGCGYILDVATLLYHDGGTDITGDVKKRLGISSTGK